MSPKGTCYFKPLYEVATVINSSLNPQVVLQKVAEATAGAVKAKACTLRLLDRSGTSLLA